MFTQQIAVTRNVSETERRIWVFWYYDSRHTLYLNYYSHQRKASKRHRNWDEIEFYSRLQRGDRSVGIDIDTLEVPSDVEQEARQQFIESLKVAKWK